MSSSSRLARQLFLSVVDPHQELVSAAELVNRVYEQRSDWLSRPEYQLILQRAGLHQLARAFCQRYHMKPEPSGTPAFDENNDDGEQIDEDERYGVVDEQYLLRFPGLQSWEKEAAKKFGKPSAYLPSSNGHKEVCRMTPDERVEAGDAGIKLGTETVDKFRILKRWGIRGGGADSH